MKGKGITLLLALALTACHAGHNHSHGEEEHEHSLEQHSHGHEQHLHAEAQVRIEQVTPGSFRPALRVSGEILSASGEEVTVSATSAGILRLNTVVTQGMQVRNGQKLAFIDAQGVTDGDQNEKARIELQSAQQELERVEQLAAKQLVTQTELLQARQRVETAKASLGNDRQSQITAPIQGYVKQCSVQTGDYVEVGQPLMTISELRHLQLRALVPENQTAQLRDITTAHLRLPSGEVLSLDSLDGRLMSTGKQVDPQLHAVPVIFQFLNNAQCTPGSVVEIWLLGREEQDVITVPTTALIEEQGIFSVFLRHGDDDYDKCEVRLGRSNGREVEILSGLKAGDNVVTLGAMHIKIATSSAVIPAHNHNH